MKTSDFNFIFSNIWVLSLEQFKFLRFIVIIVLDFVFAMLLQIFRKVQYYKQCLNMALQETYQWYLVFIYCLNTSCRIKYYGF